MVFLQKNEEEIEGGEDEIDEAEDVGLDDDLLDEVGVEVVAGDDDIEGFGLVEDKEDDDEDEEKDAEADEDEEIEESLEEDAEDVDFDTFDDIDEM